MQIAQPNNKEAIPLMYLYLRVFSMILLFKSLSFLVVVDLLYIFSVERKLASG